MRFISPLRYPGGKGKLGAYFARILAAQSVAVSAYAEPYAGGAGAGLHLLTEGYIDRLYINDLNPGIAAFWRAITQHPESFVARIQDAELDIVSWREHRRVYQTPQGRTDIELGFSTFYLNRCNRSGILGARPIGGLGQTGKWKIDARFNRSDLVARIALISTYSRNIKVSQEPALEFLAKVGKRKTPTLIYVDPPYLVQGEELYLSMHSWADHEKLAIALGKTRHPWILTYDTDDRVRKLYSYSRCLNYSISHTAHAQKVGREYMLFSRGLRVMDETVVSNRSGTWVPALAEASV